MAKKLLVIDEYKTNDEAVKKEIIRRNLIDRIKEMQQRELSAKE